ncbi:MAG TPA: hypothetical protein VHV08_17060 [Pirellulales bacterium]|nr:hypothetical protein [Pirellulales bacterium]
MAQRRSRDWRAKALVQPSRRIERLEDRRLLTADAWTGAGDGSNWSDPNNWSAGLPGAASDVTINGPGTPTIVYSAAAGSTTVHSLNGSDALSITGGSLTVSANSTLGGTLTMTGGTLGASGTGITLTANGTTTASDVSLSAAGGATLSLPHLASYSITTTPTSLAATGTGSSLSLPALTSLSTVSNISISVLASSGGHVTFATLSSVTIAPVDFYSNGAGSQIDMSALTTLHGTAGGNDSAIEVQNGGTFLHGAITTLDRVDLKLDDSSSSLTFSALTSISNDNITVAGGGNLNLSSVTSYSNSAGYYTLEATGAGSTLSLPALTTLATSGNNQVNIIALSGGHVTFAALTSVTTGPVYFESSGASSQIDVSALATLHGTVGNNDSTIEVQTGGTFLHGAITTMDRVDLKLDDSTSSLAFSALTSLTNDNITVAGGGNLNLSSVTSYSDSAGYYTLGATGAGSTLSLPALTTLAASGNNQLNIYAVSGGHVTFAALTSVTTGPVYFASSGAGSQINVSALTTLHGTVGNNDSTIEVQTGGTFSHGAITTLDRVDLKLDDSTSSLAFSALTSLTNDNITVAGGGNLNLSAVTSYSNSAGYYTLEATDVGSLLSMPALTTLTTTGNNQINVLAVSKGHVTFAALTSVTTGPVYFFTSGSGGQIDVSALTTLHGTVGNNDSTIEVETGASFLHGAITTLDRVDLKLDDSSSSLAFSALTSITNGNITAAGGALLNLSMVTSYGDSAGYFIAEATGSGSILSMPALTSLTTSGDNQLNIYAASGGHVTLAALTSVTTGPVYFYSSGAGSQINASALTTVHGTPGNNNSVIEVQTGGALFHGTIPTMDRVDLKVDDSSSSLAFAGLTSMSNANIAVSGGGSLNLSTLASYTDSVALYILEATGTGSALSLPALTSVTLSGGNTLAIEALSGGQTSLATLAQITSFPIQLISSGAGSQLSLPGLTTFLGGNSSSIQLNGGGSLVDGNNPNTLIKDVNLTFDSTFTIAPNQTFVNDTGVTISQTGTLINQGNLEVQQNFGAINVQGNLTVNGQGIVSNAIAGSVNITGSLLGNTQNANQFNTFAGGFGYVNFNGTGTAGQPQQLEAMSNDQGAVEAGFNKNFAYSTLSLSNNTYVKLVDLADNATGVAPEAVYVKELVVPAGSTLNLNGLHLYVRGSQIAGTITGGTVTTVTQPGVAYANVFYKGSAKFDVSPGNPLLPFSDDNAIASDKTAYLPGSGAATFANVSSYSRGINALMVDFAGTHGTITASDFIFKKGNNNSPGSWSTSVPTPTVAIRAGAGVGADRVELTWADNAIQKTWLEVIVKGNDALGGFDTNSGLAASYVFYVGNAPGDTGVGDASNFTVDSSDGTSVLTHPHNVKSPATITDGNDFNRDGLVDSSDGATVLANGTTAKTGLIFLTVGAGGPFAPDAPLESSGDTAGLDGAVASALAGSPAIASSAAATGLPAARLTQGDVVHSDHGLADSSWQAFDAAHASRDHAIAATAEEFADQFGVDDEWMDLLAARRQA